MSSVVPPTEVSATVVDEPSVPSSEALIPHPSTDAEAPLSSSSGKVLESPLTPEVYASGALPPGTTLGHFVIKSFIGGGGMGRVYLATDTTLDRKVALKVLPRQRANDQGTVARFMNEAKSAARLNHEHIAQVYFAGEQADIPFIVFEYVEGTNIRTLVEENGLFTVPQAITFLIQIAHALAHAAEHGVVHRDVKPSNILITAVGRAKLIDMGLARLRSESKDDLTASGVTLGTFDYISPEQARDPRAADIRSDIYSLGCTFFFMLTGQPPFPEGTVLQKLLQHQGDAPPDVRTFQPNIPSEVALLIQKMMAKDPRQRFQKPRQLVDSLIQVAEMLGLRPTEPGKLDWTVGVPGRKSVFEKHAPWLASVFVLGLLFVGLHLLWNSAAPLQPPDILSRNISETTTSQPASTRTVVSITVPENKPQVSEPERSVLSVLSLHTETIGNRWHVGDRIGIDLAAAPISAAWHDGEGKADVSETLPFSLLQEWSVSTTGSGETTIPYCIVDPSGKTPGSFLSLGTALAEIGKHATLELKWNGPHSIDPIAFVGRDLKLMATPGYAPMLSFRQNDTLVFSQHSRSMVMLNNCSLAFQNIAIEMGIDRNVLASRWTLFELFGSNKLTFTRCCLTIRNAATDYSAYHQEVAFFRVCPPQTGFETLTVDSPPPITEVESSAAVGPKAADIQLRLYDSLLRGEANALLCETSQSVDVQLEHTFAALAKAFVQIEGTKQTARQENVVRIGLDHAFIYSRQSLVRQNQTAATSDPLQMVFDVQASVVHLNQMPLFESQGTTYDPSLRWKGRGNYFQNVSLGWRLRPVLESETTREMTLAEWKDRMEIASDIDDLDLPEIRKLTHRLRPSDMLPESMGESLSVGPARNRTIRLPDDWNTGE